MNWTTCKVARREETKFALVAFLCSKLPHLNLDSSTFTSPSLLRHPTDSPRPEPQTASSALRRQPQTSGFSLPTRNNTSDKKRNTDELSDSARSLFRRQFILIRTFPPPFIFHICLGLLIHFSQPPRAPALCRFQNEASNLSSHLLKKILSWHMHVHKPVRRAKALTTPSWPICSLFISSTFCLSSITSPPLYLPPPSLLSLSLAVHFICPSPFFTSMPLAQIHANVCTFFSALPPPAEHSSPALFSASQIFRMRYLLARVRWCYYELSMSCSPWCDGEAHIEWSGARWKRQFGSDKVPLMGGHKNLFRHMIPCHLTRRRRKAHFSTGQTGFRAAGGPSGLSPGSQQTLGPLQLCV